MANAPVELSHPHPLAAQWIGGVDGQLRLIDQTQLPATFAYLDCHDAQTVHEAIRSLRVRGAPAIGVAAAFGVVLGCRPAVAAEPATFSRQLKETTAYLRTSRPTAVNLFWALERMERAADRLAGRSNDEILHALLDEAQRIFDEDRAMCLAIGKNGAELLADGAGVLTHCNAGALATSDYGTALAVLFVAHESGKRIHAFVDETRPLLQGSRLTAWELLRRGIPTTLLCDNMAAVVLRDGMAQAAIVGADRIAANGDTANKIGTYGVAVLCRAHGVPFYVAAPSSTFDFSIPTGAGIPIEHRDAREVTHGFGRQTAPDGVAVFNPAFDVTPAELISAFITEIGVLRPPYARSLLGLNRSR